MMMTVVLKMQMMHPLGHLFGLKLRCIICNEVSSYPRCICLLNSRLCHKRPCVSYPGPAWHIAYWYKTIHSMYMYIACLRVLFTYLQQNTSKPPFAQNKFSYTLRTARHPSTQVWSFCQHGWGKGIWWWKPETPASHFPWFWQKMCEISPADHRWVFSYPYSIFHDISGQPTFWRYSYFVTNSSCQKL